MGTTLKRPKQRTNSEIRRHWSSTAATAGAECSRFVCLQTFRCLNSWRNFVVYYVVFWQQNCIATESSLLFYSSSLEFIWRIVAKQKMPQTRTDIFTSIYLAIWAWKLFLLNYSFPFAAQMRDVRLMHFVIFVCWSFASSVSLSLFRAVFELNVVARFGRDDVYLSFCRDFWAACNWRYDYCYYYDLSI